MLPFALSVISESLPDMHAPTGPFDPNGEWEHSYLMWSAVRPHRGRSDGKGSLRIRRRLNPDGNIRLQLTQITKMNGDCGSGSTTAVVTCAADKLATPMRWKIESSITDPKGKEVGHTSVSVSGRTDGGSIVLQGEKELRMKASLPLTSNWSLFDAIQRLPFDSETLRFDMLEELELLKPEQRIVPGPTAEVEIGGRTVKLHSFQHFGRGILPWTYWLDDQHRLLIAVGGRRAFLLDSKAGGAK